jgi:LmbE family N-acetylglucosaminyl deacetylase
MARTKFATERGQPQRVQKIVIFDRLFSEFLHLGNFLSGVPRKQVIIGSFRESYFPSEWVAIKDWFEEVKAKFNPDIVFTHYRDDRHQDHRVLSDLAWNTFRSQMILEYEILKYDGDLGLPNVFMPLSEQFCTLKTDLLLKHFKTQMTKHWFTSDTFEATHRIRGIECASPWPRGSVLFPQTGLRHSLSPILFVLLCCPFCFR